MSDALFIVLGLAALGVGGDLLVRSAVSLGLRAGLSTLVTGLTIVALGTSAPELAVSLDAALVGSPGIALGNVVGSNFANIALVLGIIALMKPMAIDRFVLSRDLPVMLLAFLAIAATLLPDGRISALEGGVFLAAMLLYLVPVVWISRRRQSAGRLEDDPVELSASHGGLPGLMGQLVCGVALLAFGGHWLVQGGVNIAASLGVSEALIGMTVIAVGTSLPEITASVVSVLRGHGSMAVGNVVGTNIWNTFGVLGTTAAIAPLSQSEVNLTMLGMMGVAGVVLWIFCATSERISRWEGFALLSGYLVSQTLLFG